MAFRLFPGIGLDMLCRFHLILYSLCVTIDFRIIPDWFVKSTVCDQYVRGRALVPRQAARIAVGLTSRVMPIVVGHKVNCQIKRYVMRLTALTRPPPLGATSSSAYVRSSLRFLPSSSTTTDYCWVKLRLVQSSLSHLVRHLGRRRRSGCPLRSNRQ